MVNVAVNVQKTCKFHSLLSFFAATGISLIWVAILGLIVLFIYAVISFAFLHNYFRITDDASLYCETLLECMYSVLRYGLIDNIGLVRNNCMQVYSTLSLKRHLHRQNH